MARLFGAGRGRDRAAAQAEGERRQVTVLFYDIVGSVDMVQSLDVEDVRQRLLDVHDTARQLIAEHEGSLEQVMGDGGMAYFGFRRVTEDAVLQAVEAAGALLAARADMAAAPNIRIGIATGVVVVPRGGAGPASGGLGAVGVAPNLASRLQAASAPNSVLVSETTYRLTRRAFAYDRVEQLSLKGFPDVSTAWTLRDRRDIPSRFERARSTGHELVGRQAETDALRDAWATAQTGRGAALLLEGEAGIGKSRLARTALEALGPDARQILLQAQPSTASEALIALIEMYERAYENADADPALATAAAETATLVSDLEDDGALSATARRSEILKGSVEILARLIAERPCILVAEDMHWADEVTAALITALASRASDLPLLLIATARPGSPMANAGFTKLNIAPFSSDETRALIGAATSAPLSSETVQWIVEKSDGNPLFATELTRFAEDAGIASEGRPDALQAAPVDSLRDLLAARLETAGRAKRVAQIGSVIGRDVPYQLLVRLAADRIPVDEIEADLDRLIQHGITDLAADGGSYAFRHALIRDAAYDSQLKTTRKDLHGKIVDLVGREPALGETIPDEVMAEHFVMADQPASAAERLILGAERALRRSGLRGPRRMLEQALSLSDRVGDDARRRALALEAIARLGPTVSALDGRREAATLYARGQELVFELDAGDRGAWFPVLWGWWFTSPSPGELNRRSEVLLRDISRAESKEARLQALHCGWATLYDSGSHARSLAAVDEGLALYDPEEAERSRYLYGHDAKVCGLGERAQSLWMQGDVTGSLAAIAEAEAFADSIDHVPSVLHALDMATLAAFYRRDFAEIDRLLSRVAATAGQDDLPIVDAKRKTFLGWIAARSGDAGGAKQVQEGLAALKRLGALEDTAIYADIAADCAALTGAPASGFTALDHEIEAARFSGLTFWLPELLRRRATLARAADTRADVGAWLDEGLALAKSQDAHMLVLRNVATRLAFGQSIGADIRADLDACLPRIGPCPERDNVVSSLGM